MLSGELGSSLGGAALVVSCGAGGIACGLPVWLMPAPLLAGCGIALFYDSGTIRDYCIFSAGAFATALWFVHHHYWFLNIQIQTHGLRFLCQVILAALLPATLLPGLVISRGSRSVVGTLMLAQVRCYALRCAVLCCAVLCCAVLCCAVLCCALLCLLNTVLRESRQRSPMQLFSVFASSHAMCHDHLIQSGLSRHGYDMCNLQFCCL